MYLIKEKFTSEKDEQGFVSIIVTMIIMIVLTLIVTGFAQLSRREQRSVLDRQLSAQAYYAAESGINDVRFAITQGVKGLPGGIDISTNPSRTDCNAPWPVGVTITSDLDPSAAGAKFTCVLYDAQKSTAEYPTVGTDRVTVFRMSNSNITSFQIFWQDSSGSIAFRNDNCASSCAFLKASDWISGGYTGMVRIMLIPRESYDRASYRDHTFTGFLYPNANSSTGVVDSANYSQGMGSNTSGAIIKGNCNIANRPYYYCRADVNIDAGSNFGSKGYVIVLRSIYSSTSVIACINSAATPCTEPIKGAQVVVDATGRGNDVIRRVQSRFTLTPSNKDILPIGFISTDELCKQLKIDPNQALGVSDLDSINGTNCPTF